MRQVWLRASGAVLLGLGLSVACSANSAGGENPNGGGNGGGTAAAGGNGNNAGTGGGVIGTGGNVNIDASTGGTGNPGDAACTGVSEIAKQLYEPADIIWAIDTSGSMLDEAAAVQSTINAFSQQIVQTGIDVHVVMLAGYPFLLLPGICVPGPLGSGMCPPQGSDTKLPRFLHPANVFIDSTDGAKQLVQLFPVYKQMLRPGALKYVVVVTDDDSRNGQSSGSGGTGDPGPYDNNPDLFIKDFTALDPMFSNGGTPTWSLSAVYSFTKCPNAAIDGIVWKDIVNKTGGVHGDICQCTQAAACATAFQGIFNKLATKIIQGSKPLTCEWQIPPPPAGQTLDPSKVNVDFINQDKGTKETLFHVNDVNACDPNLGGWYFDNNQLPASVKACPASCNKITAVTQGRIDVIFGCQTINLPR
ncbi:MAG: hypothetical protein R3B13_09060 [Polyangiaceae bacterium]